MFEKIDCIRFHVSDLDAALMFYRERLGLKLIWRRGEKEAGLRIGETEYELILIKEDLEFPEIDFMVESVDSSIMRLMEIGSKVLVEPFEIGIGKCSVIEDPWNNRFVILDRSKGFLKVDQDKNVVD